MFIFAVGIMVASVVEHKLVVEGARFRDFGMWGVVAEFVVLAPPVFLMPLLFFTRTLARAKRAGRTEYDVLIARYGNAIHEKWHREAPSEEKSNLPADFAALADAKQVYELINRMRIVPFDLASAAKFAASAGGPMVPVALHLLPQPASLRWLLQAIK